MREYRQDIHRCEVSEYIGFDASSADETHHIRGGHVRGRVEANTAANYIAVSDRAHKWIHANSSSGDVACWYAKYIKQCRRLEMDEYGTPNDWQPSTIDCICDGGGLAGRISGILIPRIEEFGGDDAGRYLGYAEQLLKALGE